MQMHADLGAIARLERTRDCFLNQCGRCKAYRVRERDLLDAQFSELSACTEYVIDAGRIAIRIAKGH